MKKFEGILICTDLDGTLLNEKRRVSEENLKAIRYFQGEGGRFTFVTGRPYYNAAEIYQAVLPNAPVGCFNGGAVYDFSTGSYLHLQGLSYDALELVKCVERELPSVGIVLVTPEKDFFARDTDLTRKLFYLSQPRALCSCEEFSQPLVKVILAEEDPSHMEALISLLQNHPRRDEFDFIRSEETLYEILPKGVNKGAVLPRLCEILKLDPKKTIAVGDYDNDVAMIAAAGIGIAVENAVPEAKAVADIVTVSNEEHAIARIIADLDSGALQFSEI